MLISLGFRHFDFPEMIVENGFGEMDRVFGRFLGNFWEDAEGQKEKVFV